MNAFDCASRIVITCPNRISAVLTKDLEELGVPVIRTFNTGVELKGTVRDCIRLNLSLRCASQVYYSLHRFACESPQQLYDELKSLPWETIIAPETYFSITSNVDHPTINNELFANVRVKDAIVDRFRDKTGTRPNSGPELHAAVFHLFWREGVAEVFIDTSGETLAKHGYRKIPGKAPMMESLAAATILATKWDRLSKFVNPMCGSGTLAIEAALISTNRRPGLYRNNYAFRHIIGFDEQDHARERDHLKSQIHHAAGFRAIATDISEDAINVSRINAGAAGVEDLIDFNVCDFMATPVPQENKGIVFLNPEYGERLGEEVELADTYARIGDFLKKQCKGYMGYVFTGNLELAKKIGLKAKRRIEFYTGKIDCRLLEYELYEGSRRQE